MGIKPRTRCLGRLFLFYSLVLAGCASLNPTQNRALEDAQAFADATMGVYGGGPVRVFAGQRPAGVGATFEDGTITLNHALIPSPYLDALMAHELGHAVLGHEGPVSLNATEVLTQRELDANAKAVEILVRIKGKGEVEALRMVLEFLQSAHATLLDQPAARLPLGHPPLCVQIADLLRRFPEHRAWADSFRCAG